jgi:ankyrin repeat protein
MKKTIIILALSACSSLLAMDHTDDDYRNYGLELAPQPGFNGNTPASQSASSSTHFDLQLKTAIKTRQPASLLISLIKQGANPTNALFEAVNSNSYIEYLPLLLQFGANPNTSIDVQESILEYSMSKDPIISKLLLQHGAKPTWLAWQLGCILNCKTIIPLLWYRWDPDTILDSQYTTALIKLSSKQSVSALDELIESLLLFGANPNHVNTQNESALITNVISGVVQYQAAIIKHLLAYGANPHLRDNFNKSALDYAHSYKRTSEIKQLIQQGIAHYQCLICMERENKNLTLLPCTNKHLGNFICPECLITVKAHDNSCPLCRNKLS